MNLTNDTIQYIDQSVLCWLATASADNIPNVSPKEIFTYHGRDYIIIANIASPQTVRNIKQNPNVCVSFVDVLVQKGYQIKGTATIVDDTDPDYGIMQEALTNMTGGKFPFATITKILVDEVKPILAPSYLFFPETTEEEQVKKAKTAYGLNP
jgi:predicted pyridoxine 5'-phosphate oxidase superfamily flavin-nucleotide-binding protein